MQSLFADIEAASQTMRMASSAQAQGVSSAQRSAEMMMQEPSSAQAQGVSSAQRNAANTNTRKNVSATNTNTRKNVSATNARNNSLATNARNNSSATNATNAGNNSSARGPPQIPPKIPPAEWWAKYQGAKSAKSAKSNVTAPTLTSASTLAPGVSEHNKSDNFVHVLNAKISDINSLKNDMMNIKEEIQLPAIKKKVIESEHFATASDVEGLKGAIANMAIPDTSKLALASDVAAIKDTMPDISKLALASDIDQIRSMLDPSTLLKQIIASNYFATVSDVGGLKGAIAKIAIPDTSKLALASDIVSIKSMLDPSTILKQIIASKYFATASDVEGLKGAIAKITIPDISNLALASDLAAIKDAIKEVKDAQAKIVLPDTYKFATASSVQKLKDIVSKIDIPDTSTFALASDLEEIKNSIPDTSQIVKPSDVNKRVSSTINKLLAPINAEIESINNSINKLQENIPEENIPQEGGKRRKTHRLRK